MEVSALPTRELRALQPILWLAFAAVAALAQPERDVVVSNRPLTAIGQHSPSAHRAGDRYCFLRYAVRPNGELGQDLYVTTVDGTSEKRITNSSLVYHPVWRQFSSRIVCVAIPERITRALRPGIYELDASGESEPVAIMQFAREDIPFAPTVSPDDTRLAYYHYSTDPDRSSRLWVHLYDLARARSLGEAPWPDEAFSLSEASGPWWHDKTRLRVLGTRITDRGSETAVYELDLGKNSWRKVFRLPQDEVVSSFAYCPTTKRLAYLRQSDEPGRQDVMVCGDDGRDPYPLFTVLRPLKHLVRPFPDDIAWLPSGDSLIVTSGPNLVLLKLGKASEGGVVACKENMLRIYRALIQYAYDHGGALPHWDDDREAFGTPYRNPFFWVTAIGDAYLPDPSAFRCPLDTRARNTAPSSYKFNLDLAGRLFDIERQKKKLVILEEAGTWHDGSRLVLYTNGEFDLVTTPAPE